MAVASASVEGVAEAAKAAAEEAVAPAV